MLIASDLSAIQREALVGVDCLSVSAAIVHDRKMLLCTRSATEDFLPGYSELVGGGVDDGESLWDALHREVREETGIEITSVVRRMPGFEYEDGSGRTVRECSFIVTCDTSRVRLNPAEHDAFYWLGPEDLVLLAGLRMTPEQRSLVDGAFMHLAGL